MNEQPMQIAYASGREETNWDSEPVTWPEFVRTLREPRVLNITREQYEAFDIIPEGETKVQARKRKDTKGRIKNTSCYVPVTLHGPRKNMNIHNRFMVTLDADFLEAWQYEALKKTIESLPYRAIAHTTLSHIEEAPRLRILIPLSRPADRAEYAAVSRLISREIFQDMNIYDDSTFEITRLMYLPYAMHDKPVEFVQSNGTATLDPGAFLEWATNARGFVMGAWETYPVSDRVKMAPEKSDFSKQQDPLEKDGFIGAFCREYDIAQAIAEFLPDKYEPVSDTRYTYVDGEGFGGMTTYDEGRFSFSFHGTDPTFGLLCNAWDLVRIHLFGNQDKGAKEGTPSHKLPSQRAMEELAGSLPSVKSEALSQQLNIMEEFATEFAEAQQAANTNTTQANEQLTQNAPSSQAAQHDMSWTDKLDLNKNGTLRNTINNFVLLLRHTPSLVNCCFTNLFDAGLYAIGPTPWNPCPEQRGWVDADDSGLKNYFEQAHGLTGGKLFDAMALIATERTFHPVRDYLIGLPEWDGVPRIGTLATDYLGAEDTPINRAYMTKTLVAAVKRVFEPGCKVDTMLTFVGDQGIGKSSIADVLGGEWFSDTPGKIGTKEGYEALDGVWIMEFGELSAMKKVEIEATKHYLSKRTDKYRRAYARRTSDNPRQVIFIGSTNEVEFLRDGTGNRRFWPITCSVQKPRLINSPIEAYKALPLVRDQIMAEAFHLYFAGETVYLNAEENKMALVTQDNHMQHDGRFGQLEEFVNRELPADWYEWGINGRRLYLEGMGEPMDHKPHIPRLSITSQEVWAELWGNELKTLTPMAKREINIMLAQIPGWERTTVRAKEPNRYYGTTPVSGFKRSE